MEIGPVLEKIRPVVKKYRYLFLIVMAGIILLSIPSKGTVQNEARSSLVERPDDPSVEDRLAQILRMIDGAGDVDVMLTEKAGERTIYQTDVIGQNERQDTVIVTGADRQQYGLVQQSCSAEYRGAVIVCQGAGDPAVRLAIVDAVSRATGLGADRIIVLKMK